MITLYLCRHGNTFEDHQTPTQVGAKTDLELTAKGHQQGVALGTYFAKHKPMHHIYAGPLKRQMQTAEHIQKKLDNVAISVIPLLSEIDYGDWEGLTTEALQAKWPEAYRLWTETHTWPENIFGESKHAYQLRLNTFLEEVKTHHASQTILAVTSNGLLQLLHSLITHEPKAAKVKTGHWCEIHLDENHIEVVRWNEAPE